MYKLIYNYMHTFFSFIPDINQKRPNQIKYINKIANIEIAFTAVKK